MLTETQAKCLKFIAERIRDRGECPSYAEVTAAMGWTSRSVAKGVIDRLVFRGYLTTIRGRGRSLSVVKLPRYQPNGATFYRVVEQGGQDEVDFTTGTTVTGRGWP